MSGRVFHNLQELRTKEKQQFDWTATVVASATSRRCACHSRVLRAGSGNARLALDVLT